MKHEVTRAVQAPVDVVWRTMSELERWPEWTPTVTAVDATNSDGVRVGDTAKVVQPGQRDRTWTITEVRGGESFTWEATDPGGLKLTAVHRVVSDGNGAATVELSFAVAGPIAWLAGLMAGKTIRKAVETEAESLKEWCEKHCLSCADIGLPSSAANPYCSGASAKEGRYVHDEAHPDHRR